MSTSAALDQQEKNARGIPKAPFISDVEEYLGVDPNVENALKDLQSVLAKYRYMDGNLATRRRSLEEKIPDIRKTLSMVEFLQERRIGKTRAGEGDEDDLEDVDDLGDEEVEKKPLTTTFELNDTLFAEAELEDTDTVYLWLGANVMLSYKLPAAVSLLSSKLEAAQSSLSNVISDLEFLREQITIMEVNIARVYNWDVKKRRDKRELEEAASGGDGVGKLEAAGKDSG